jgi:putative oxidoreductase
MVLTQKIEQWTDTHHPAWLDVVRFFLGLFLFSKGIAFLQDIWGLQKILQNINIDYNSLQLAYIIAFVHIIGGLLIAIGLFTRPAILFQLPILFGAIIFNWPGFEANEINQMVPGGVLFVWPDTDSTSVTAEWWTSLIVFLLLVLFYVFNSGRWSVDNYLKTYEEE